MDGYVKRLMVALSTIVSLAILAFPWPVFAGDGEVGSDIVLVGGYVGTLIGHTSGGKPVYQTDFSAPQYLPDLVTRIDTTWKEDGTKFVAGANLYRAMIEGEMATVSDNDAAMSWSPSASIGQTRKQPKDKAKVLPIDPMNANYRNNTIEWDYGNGLYRRVRLIEGLLQEYYVLTQPMPDDVAIESYAVVIGDMSKRMRVPEAWDADGKSVPIDVDNGKVRLTRSKAFDAKLKYPVIIDPDTTFTTSASDAYVVKVGLTYSDARNAATSSYTYGAEQTLRVGQSIGNYTVSRAGVYFNTASLAGYDVQSASLKLYGYQNYSLSDFDITVQSGMPTYPHDPMVTGDFDQSQYAGNGGSLSTSGYSTVGYNTITLNATGIGWINTSGTTKFILRSSEDINNSAPTNAEYVLTYSYEMGVGYRPQLIVTYVTTAPSVIVNDASDIAKTTARLNATLLDDGGDTDTDIRFGYGQVSHAAVDFEDYTVKTAWVSGYASDDKPYVDVATLDATTTYYFRVQARNITGTTTSTDEESFTTESDIGDMASFYGIPSDTSINLYWVKGVGDSGALVRYRVDTYPIDTTDGTLVYSGTATSYEHTGLSNGKTYFYSIWGESGGVYSSNELNLAMTTHIEDTSGVAPTEPSVPNEMYQDTTPSNLEGLGGVYTIVTAFLTSFGMPAASGWLTIYLAGVSLVAFWIWSRTGKLFIAAIVICLGIVLGIMMHVVPGYVLVVILPVALGTWAIEGRGTV